ncbi:laccase [Chytriomyces hyalinus]|nr:laccase [Chytriomyces hyalinus]
MHPKVRASQPQSSPSIQKYKSTVRQFSFKSPQPTLMHKTDPFHPQYAQNIKQRDIWHDHPMMAPKKKLGEKIVPGKKEPQPETTASTVNLQKGAVKRTTTTKKKTTKKATTTTTKKNTAKKATTTTTKKNTTKKATTTTTKKKPTTTTKKSTTKATVYSTKKTTVKGAPAPSVTSKSTLKTSHSTSKTSTTKATTKTVTLNLATKTLSPDGVPKTMLIANDQLDFEIHVNKGDTLVAVVNNNLNVSTSIHWHGIFQIGSPWMDGPGMVTQCLIAPSKSMTYTFSVGSQTGTYWWHAHYASQYVDGIRGPFIIHDPTDPYLSRYDEEIIVSLSDNWHADAQTVLKGYVFAYDPAPDSGLINGMGRYNCSHLPKGSTCTPDSPRKVFEVKKGKRYRIRIINMSSQAMFKVSIDNHMMTVIEADGVNTNPTVVSSFEISSSQRYSVLVNAAADIGNYWFRATISDMYTVTGTTIENGVDFNVLGIWRYAGAPESDPEAEFISDKIPLDVYHLGELNGLTLAQVPDYSQSLYLDFTLLFDDASNNTFGVMTILSDETNFFFSEYFVPKTEPFLKTLLDGGELSHTNNVYDVGGNNWIFLQVRNSDNIEHVFHLHGHAFYIIGSGRQLHALPDAATLPRRDAIQVPKCVGGTGGGEAGCVKGYVNLMIHFNHPGAWLFHCHVDWHMAVGLSMTFVNRENLDSVRETIPKNFWDECQTH